MTHGFEMGAHGLKSADLLRRLLNVNISNNSGQQLAHGVTGHFLAHLLDFILKDAHFTIDKRL